MGWGWLLCRGRAGSARERDELTNSAALPPSPHSRRSPRPPHHADTHVEKGLFLDQLQATFGDTSLSPSAKDVRLGAQNGHWDEYQINTRQVWTLLRNDGGQPWTTRQLAYLEKVTLWALACACDTTRTSTQQHAEVLNLVVKTVVARTNVLWPYGAGQWILRKSLFPYLWADPNKKTGVTESRAAAARRDLEVSAPPLPSPPHAR